MIVFFFNYRSIIYEILSKEREKKEEKKKKRKEKKKNVWKSFYQKNKILYYSFEICAVFKKYYTNIYQRRNKCIRTYMYVLVTEYTAD